MSTYTDDELGVLLASGDAQENSDGSITWAIDNSYDKKPGTWLIRPPKAAPLITQEISVELAKLRHEKRLVALEDGLALGASKAIGQAVTSDEAVMLLTATLTEAGFDITRKDYSRLIKIIYDVLGLTQHKTKVDIDARRQSIEVSAEGVKIIDSSPAIKRLRKSNGD
jgi:hypothetical protein